MATYQELRTRSQQVRDEQNIGGNTALRVGQLLMDIVKFFYDNDAAASEYLQQHFAMVNDGTQLLNWQQSPIVILHTMGETYDEGDFSSLSQGENFFRNGFIMEADGQGGGINGETPKANVLYVNLANDTLYTWNGSSFDAITSGGGGSILNVKDNNVYKVWVGTEAELEALDGDYEDNTIYLVGVTPTVAQRFNVTFNGGSHTSIPANTPQTVKEGSAFSVIVSPASGYTIDTATGTMTGGTLTKTNNQDGTVTFSTSAVTGAITITAAATKHITGIAVSSGTRSGNTIPLTAVVAPSGADNVTLAWSVNDTTNFGISGSGTDATLTVKSGASNSSVTITCQDTNASSDTASGTLQLTGLSYAEAPITEITDISATRTSANTLTLDATADSSTPTIEYSLVGTVPTVKQVRRWEAGDEVDGETQAEAGSDLIDVPAVVLSGNTLTYKDDCQVTLKATAGSVESDEKTITITHDSADAIWFEDDVVKGLLLTAGFGSNGEITYTQAASSVGTQTNNQAVFKNNTTIIHFNEWQWFTNSRFNVSGCSALESVKLPKLANTIVFDSSFGIAGTEISSVEIPNGYTTYGASSGSFTGSPIQGTVTEIIFPSSLTTMVSMFSSLSDITEIDMTGSSVTNTVYRQFSYLSNLATVKLPNTLTTITQGQTFRECTALTRVEFGTGWTGSSISLYYDGAFAEARAMTYVFRSTTPPTAVNFASNQNNKRTVDKILVPRAAVDTYKASSVFSSYVDKISAIEDEEA